VNHTINLHHTPFLAQQKLAQDSLLKSLDANLQRADSRKCFRQQKVKKNISKQLLKSQQDANDFFAAKLNFQNFLEDPTSKQPIVSVQESEFVEFLVDRFVEKFPRDE
jgi:hypothetical protein